jgi:hypothetical protein
MWPTYRFDKIVVGVLKFGGKIASTVARFFERGQTGT